VFLANRAKVNKKRRSLAYAVSLGVRVPDYEIEKKLWINKHYEGSYLYRDSIVVELVPPVSKDERWKVKYAWQGQGASPASKDIDPQALRGGKIEVSVPFDSKTRPGMSGTLRFVVSAWNPDAVMNDKGEPLDSDE
jgi:hypothetical protein